MKTLKIIVVFAFIISTLNGMSQFYIGGGVGNSFLNQNLTDVNGDSFKMNKNSFGYKVFAGFGHKLISFVGGYRDLGTVSNTVNGSNVQSSIRGGCVAYKPQVNLGPIYAFGEIGGFFYKNKYSINEYKQALNEAAFLWGLGLGINIKKIDIGLQWESLTLEQNSSISQLIIDFKLCFGKR